MVSWNHTTDFGDHFADRDTLVPCNGVLTLLLRSRFIKEGWLLKDRVELDNLAVYPAEIWLPSF